MRKLTLHDLKDIAEYEKGRDQFRNAIIQLKAKRRVSVGDKIGFVFENRETVRFQIQEMMRVERIVDDVKIQEELDVYNPLIPDSGELSATMFVEIREQSQIKPELLRLTGITRLGCVFIRLGGDEIVPAIFEEGREEDDRVSAVQYCRFPFTQRKAQLFADPGAPVELVIEHPNYQTSAFIEGETRESLLEDLGDES